MRQRNQPGVASLTVPPYGGFATLGLSPSISNDTSIVDPPVETIVGT